MPEYWFIAIEITILIIGWLIYLYLKSLPEAIHQRSLKRLEHDLSTELENLKSSLAKEIELLKISQTEIQMHKTRELTELAEFYNNVMADKQALNQMTKSPKVQTQYNKLLMDLGTKLFFFASDSTIRKYLEMRRYSQKEYNQQPDPRRLLRN